MNALRILFASLWLLFGVSVTAHAMPVTDAPCHGDSQHDKAPKPTKSAMACCGQPAPLELPAPVSLGQPAPQALHLEPARSALPAGIIPAADPRPPKRV